MLSKTGRFWSGENLEAFSHEVFIFSCLQEDDILAFV